MKKTNLFLMSALASSLMLSSCKDEVEEIATDQSGQVQEKDAGKVVITDTFSPLTPEENKKQLEDDGLTMVQEMRALKNAPAVDASYAFTTFLDRSTPSTDESARRMTHTARVLGRLGKDQASTKDVFATMRGTESEDESLQAIFDENVGTWAWNTEKQDWDFSKGGDKVVYQFPSTESGTQNNAVYTIYAYEGLDQNHPYGDYEGDLPTNIQADLTVDSQKQLGYTFTAQYNADGEPEDVASSLSVGTFEFAATVQNNTQKVGARYSFKSSGKTLLAFGAGVYGDFTAENIKAADGEEEIDADAVLDRVDAYFQVVNVVMAGDFDANKYFEDTAEIHDSEENDEDGNVEEEAKILNETLNLVAFYADGSGKIAESEIYTYTEIETGLESSYEETFLGLRMIFEDESKADLETYFGEGFDALITEFEKFQKEVNEDFE